MRSKVTRVFATIVKIEERKNDVMNFNSFSFFLLFSKMALRARKVPNYADINTYGVEDR